MTQKLRRTWTRGSALTLSGSPPPRRRRRFFAQARLDPHAVPEFERPVAPPLIPPVHQCIRTVQPPVLGSIAFALLYGR